MCSCFRKHLLGIILEYHQSSFGYEYISVVLYNMTLYRECQQQGFMRTWELPEIRLFSWAFVHYLARFPSCSASWCHISVIEAFLCWARTSETTNDSCVYSAINKNMLVNLLTILSTSMDKHVDVQACFWCHNLWIVARRTVVNFVVDENILWDTHFERHIEKADRARN